MLASIIIIIISFILDGVLTNFLPYGVENISLFTPLLTIVALVVIYNFFYHEEKNYYILSFIIGILYDLFYTNLLFLDGLLFLLIAFVITKIYKVVGFNYMWIALDILISIIIYECSFALVIVIFNLVPMSIYRLLYKISHSIILNIIYGELLYFIIRLLPKKYKKVRIN